MVGRMAGAETVGARALPILAEPPFGTRNNIDPTLTTYVGRAQRAVAGTEATTLDCWSQYYTHLFVLVENIGLCR